MAKFKKGDRVRLLQGLCVGVCRINPGTICIIDGNDEPLPHYHTEDGQHHCFTNEDNFELIEDKPMKYAVGQVLERDGCNYTREIIANFADRAFVLIDSSDDYAQVDSLRELEDEGWHLKTTPENTEMTVKEIEDKLGVKNLKVVKEAK